MNSQIFFVFKIQLILVLVFSSVHSEEVIDNLFKHNNSHFYATKKLNNLKFHKFIENDTATIDGSGSLLLAPQKYFHWYQSEKIFLEKNQIYTVRLSIKMVGSQKGKKFKGQNVMIGILGNSKWRPSYWNVAKENQWEEVIFQFIAQKSKYYKIGIATFKNSIIEEKYNLSNKPPPLASKVNLDKSVRIYVDDFFVGKSSELSSGKKRTKRKSFESENVKIDVLGNWSVKEDKQWKSIFPKLIYPGNPYIIKNNIYTPNFIYHYPAKKYADYGFNGLADVTYEGYIENAIISSKGKLRYFSKQLNTKERFSKNENNSLSFKYRLNGVLKYLENVKEDHLKLNDNALYLMHSFDNENDWLRDYKFRDELEEYLRSIDWDDVRKQRKSPLYMLNGTYGTTKTNRNIYRDIMDVTGTYVGGDSLGNVLNTPVATLDVINKMQYQVVPGSVIQLQCYYHDKFIPSLFYGIIQGGTAVVVWKDGTSIKGCKKDFNENSWANALKGKEGVFARIDRILPIIKTDRNKVTWDVTSADTSVKIGKRDYNGKHYIILAHYGDTSKFIKLKLKNLTKLKARDYFTKKVLLKIDKHHLEVFMDTGNNGYRVIELY